MSIEYKHGEIKCQGILKSGGNCKNGAYDLKGDIMESYQDVSIPRGHEFILYTMLTHKKEDYPWIQMTTFDF